MRLECLKFEIFLNEFDVTVHIPKISAYHASDCKSCLYWLSNTLAITEAFSMVERGKISGNCPGKKVFQRLLMIIMRGQDKIRILSGKTELRKEDKRNFLYETAAEIASHQPIFAHMEDCKSCKKYYEDLHEHMLGAEKRYKRNILDGKELIPIYLDMSKLDLLSDQNQ